MVQQLTAKVLLCLKNRHILRDAIVDNINPCLDLSPITDKEVSLTDFMHRSQGRHKVFGGPRTKNILGPSNLIKNLLS